MLVVAPQSSHLGTELRVVSSELWLWLGFPGSCSPLTPQSFQHQRTILEGDAQEECGFQWWSGSEGGKEGKLSNLWISVHPMHVLVVSCHRAWPHLGPIQPIKHLLSIRESQWRDWVWCRVWFLLFHLNLHSLREPCFYNILNMTIKNSLCWMFPSIKQLNEKKSFRSFLSTMKEILVMGKSNSSASAAKFTDQGE